MPARGRLIAGLFVLAMTIAAFLGWRSLDGAGSMPPPSHPQTSLADVEAAVARRYRVPEIGPEDLKRLLGRSGFVLFDVREATEFDESHIAGARRIAPGMSPETFMARFGSEIAGRHVVFYCSVGARSGDLLSRVQADLSRSRAAAVYNLRGGIFRWFANGHPVVSSAGTARSVHSFDPSWGSLLSRTLENAR